MPVKKTTKKATKPRATKKAKDEETLLEFEEFVSQKTTNSGNGRGKGYLAMTLIFIIIVLGALWMFMSKGAKLEVDAKFKAVYLENGQTYYAKVVKEDALNIYLDDIYYIQTEQTTIPAEEEDGEPQVISVPVLVKRGGELHRPEGWMQVNRDKLLAIEEIGPDSEILAEIERINSL